MAQSGSASTLLRDDLLESRKDLLESAVVAAPTRRGNRDFLPPGDGERLGIASHSCTFFGTSFIGMAVI